MTLSDWSLPGVIVAVLAGGLAGWCATAVRSWTLARRLTELAYRVEDQEVRLVREIKQRASLEGVKVRGRKLEDDVQAALALGGDPGGHMPPSLNWADWYRRKMRSGGK